MDRPAPAPVPLDELLEDQSRCWQRRELPPIEVYLQRHPDLPQRGDDLLDLIAHEIVLRERGGEQPPLSEYLRRFPVLADGLHALFAAHDAARQQEAAAPTLAEAPPAPPSPSLAVLFEQLTRTGLLQAKQVAELSGLWPADLAAPRALGRELLRRDWLTPLQVNRLLQGQAEQLVLGGYVVLSRLGEGGMGTVYKARHQKLDRLVALKVLRQERLGSPELQQRFLREVRAASQVNHPNIVLAYDAGTEARTTYIAMEYVEGIDLARRLRQQGPLTLSEALLITVQTLRGLQHAHERGLVHRDVKPSNLMLTAGPDGLLVKVLDLGLARLNALSDESEQLTRLTRDGVMLGTPDYIAPEQIRDPHRTDARADLYSLGCTLYHMLAGRPPYFGAAVGGKLLRHQTEEPPPIEHLQPEASAVLARLMAKAPEDRYPSAAAAVDALEALLQGRPLPDAHTPSTVAPVDSFVPLAAPPSPPSRRRLLVIGASLLAVVGLAVAFWPRRQDTPVTPETPTPQSAFAHLNTLRMVEGEKYPWQPAALVAVLGRHGFRHPADENASAARGLCWGADGSWFVSTARDGFVRVWDAGTQRELQVLSLRGRGSSEGLALSSQSQRLVAVDGNHNLKVWDRTQAGFVERGTVASAGIPVVLALSGDGAFLAAGCREGQVQVWQLDQRSDLDALAPVEVFRHDKKGVSGLAFSADGTLLFSAGADGQLVRLKRQGATWQRDHGWKQPTGILAMALAPNDATLVTSNARGGVRVWEARTNRTEPRAVFDAHEGSVGAVAIGRDSTLLATCVNGELKLWDLRSERPSVVAELPLRSRDYLHELAFAPDGRTLALTGSLQGVRVWTEVAGVWQEREPVRGHTKAVRALAFSGDGRRLVSGGVDHSLWLWQLDRAEPEAFHLATLTEIIGHVQLSRSADRVYFGGRRGTWVDPLETNRFGPPRRLTTADDSIRDLAYSSSGPFLAEAVGDRVRLWSTLGPALQHLTPLTAPSPAQCLSFSGDGKILAVGGDNGRLRVWSRAEGVAVRWKDHPDPAGHEKTVTSVSFSADGSLLASSGLDGSIRLWRRKGDRWELERDVGDQRSMTHSVALSGDGRRLAAACSDGRLLWWDTATGQPGEWKSPRGVSAVAWAPDHRHLACGNTDGTIYLLRLN